MSETFVGEVGGSKVFDQFGNEQYFLGIPPSGWQLTNNMLSSSLRPPLHAENAVFLQISIQIQIYSIQSVHLVESCGGQVGRRELPDLKGI